jgi:hypothetical protein
MKIFGIGLSKTGTVSLTDILKILGYDAIHAPLPLYLCDGLRDTIDNHDGFTDSNIAYQYKELDKLYPNSKFILTIRPIIDWLRSYETFLLDRNIKIDPNWRKLQYYLYGSRVFNRRKFRKGFVKHYYDVKKYFKDRPDDLFIMDFGKTNRWKEVCDFLGKPIPRLLVSWSDTVTYIPEFPHQNKTTEERKQRYNKNNKRHRYK